jgi:hypothetical protein
MGELQGRYEAPRYWLPEGQEIPLIDGGFMPDPRGPYSYAVPGAKALDELAEASCLVLIGEPGSGKTTAMTAEYERLAGSVGDEDRALLVELGFTRVEAELRAAIFGSAEFREWREGEGRLFLFLDSLDEARLHIEHVAKLLLSGLENAPFRRLVLRVSCRSADRHHTLEAELQQRFGADRYQVRELAPLCRVDIAAAARANGLDDRFLKEVIAKELQPLAMVPESLKFLLRVAKETGALPARRLDAFEQGLRLLAREPDEDRRDGGAGGKLSPTERMAICARVAAALTLSGRTAIWTDDREPGPDVASLSELTGGHEVDSHIAVERKFEVDPAALKEALGTAILTAAGSPARLRFAQASYAEFLTARWLADGGLSPEQRASLLFSSEGKVVPQLTEVVAWLASLSPDFHQELLKVDPVVLLRAEPEALDPDERKLVIDALLAGVRSFEVDRWDRRTRENYELLTHPTIAEQLRPMILNAAEETHVRQVACDLAGASGIEELSEDLMTLSLDSAADLQVRAAALSALVKLASPEQRERLRILATRNHPEDEDDELKGAALRLLWPGTLDVEELLGCLTPPKRQQLLGLYRMFVMNEVVKGLQAEDLPAALRWSAGQPISHFATDPLLALREELLVAAWPHLTDDGEVRDAFVGVVATLLTSNANLLSTSLREQHPAVFVEQAGRRVLVEGLIPCLQKGGLDVAELLFATPRLLVAEDMEWLIQKLTQAIGDDCERPLAELVNHLPILGASELEVLEAREKSPVLRELSAARFDAVRIDSPAADRARSLHALRLEVQHEEEEQEPSIDDLDIPARVSRALDTVEAGEFEGFWIATKWLEINERRERELFVSDLRAMTGWELIGEDNRERLMAAARGYLLKTPIEAQGWFGKGRVNWPAWAGYRALRLLTDLDPTELDSLPPSVWERWAPVIINWPRESMGATGEPTFNDAMLEMLFARAPAAASQWVAKLLDLQLRGDHAPFVLHRLEEIWTPELEDVLLRRAKRPALDPRKRRELLGFLIAKGSESALSHARRLLTPAALAAGGRRRELALQVAAILGGERGATEWDRCWRLMQADEEFGRELVEALAENENQPAANLPPARAAELFLWVEERYPAREDPRVEGAHHPSVREQIGMWRGRIPAIIAAQGTREAVVVLGRLAQELPAHISLRRYKRDAEEILERAEWQPPRSQDVLRLSEDERRRYIRSAQDLKRVLITSFGRAQTRLTGQDGQAAFLWDSEPLHPKREPLIGEWLANHLRTELEGRGIFVGREVGIRVNARGYMGESVDILTEAIAGRQVEGTPMVRVATELKCCWHADLDTAMRDQLVANYLDDEHNQGIYLVAHFDSPRWTDSHTDKRRRCRKRGPEELREFFTKQAAEVNDEGLAEVTAVVLDFSVSVRDS